MATEHCLRDSLLVNFKYAIICGQTQKIAALELVEGGFDSVSQYLIQPPLLYFSMKVLQRSGNET